MSTRRASVLVYVVKSGVGGLDAAAKCGEAPTFRGTILGAKTQGAYFNHYSSLALVQ